MKLINKLNDRVVAYVVLIVVFLSSIWTGYTSQQQLSQAKHINSIVRCQTNVNNRFNETLKYNTNLSQKTNTLNDKDRTNLTNMVADIGDGIDKNNGAEIRKAIKDYNIKRVKIDKQRKDLAKARANYPPLPKDVCK